MSNLLSTLERRWVNLVVSDPRELADSIPGQLLRCVVLREGIRPASGFGPAREAILLRLLEPFTLDDVRYEYLQGESRHEGSSIGDLRRVGTEVHCDFVLIPRERLKVQPPLDLSWWRGGGGLTAELSLDWVINVDHLRWSLEELSSLEEQKRLWLGAGVGEMSSFEEACCSVFGDSGVTTAMEKGWLRDRYGSEIVRQFESLDALIQKVPLNLRPLDKIGLPILDEIRATAKRLLESGAFDSHSTDT